ncbi:hypothetical protein Y032_0455g1765 [Ancylostoma ceylanicum]|uniref:Neurotransmitter-gated ion-channel transmembrane domain-containing protein n=1 Tax=Ancylostoma ceylanicum TaxID=53326 RepID=A0A016X069_9BILA|nr:hypothetical protein Y032_0455g1765 [Ancylostoma ceylanicum]
MGLAENELASKRAPNLLCSTLQARFILERQALQKRPLGKEWCVQYFDLILNLHINLLLPLIAIYLQSKKDSWGTARHDETVPFGDIDDPLGSKPGLLTFWQKWKLNADPPKMIDLKSRVIFPLLFLMFNIVYWIWCASAYLMKIRRREQVTLTSTEEPSTIATPVDWRAAPPTQARQHTTSPALCHAA